MPSQASKACCCCNAAEWAGAKKYLYAGRCAAGDDYCPVFAVRSARPVFLCLKILIPGIETLKPRCDTATNNKRDVRSASVNGIDQSMHFVQKAPASDWLAVESGNKIVEDHETGKRSAKTEPLSTCTC